MSDRAITPRPQGSPRSEFINLIYRAGNFGMPDPTLVHILIHEGAKGLRVWREAHPDARPDLSSADLRERDLENVSFEGADLRRALLVNSRLNHANFTGADLK